MSKENFYYLRKDDRALYKANAFSRYFRDSYPEPTTNPKGLHLFTAKKISTLLKHRDYLHDYCDEWFDVYNQDNEIVDISEENEKYLLWSRKKIAIDMLNELLSDFDYFKHESPEGDVIRYEYVKEGIERARKELEDK